MKSWYVVGKEPPETDYTSVFGPMRNEEEARIYANDVKDDNGWESVEAEYLTDKEARMLTKGKIINPYRETVVPTTNIVIGYAVNIRYNDDTYRAPKGAEFFMDEHGIQWVKFYPINGPKAGKEHIMRTENIMVIKEGGP
jgi:hypothetical protein